MSSAVALLDRVRPLADSLVGAGFRLTADGGQADARGARVELRSAEFVINVVRDRDREWVTVGTTVRPRPRAPLGWWPLGHLVAFLDGRADPYGQVGLDTELGWLGDRRDEIFDVALINSEELRRWAVRASRRLFGQRPRG